MQLNICVDPEDEARVRSATTWEELANTIPDTLAMMEGPCVTAVAAMSGLSIQTVYNLRRRSRPPTTKTLRALVGVLAPGHALAQRRSCAIPIPSTPVPQPPTIELRPIPGYPQFLARYVNGKFSGLPEDVVRIPDRPPVGTGSPTNVAPAQAVA